MGEVGLTSAFVNSTFLLVKAVGAAIGLNTTVWLTWAQAVGALLTIEAISAIVAIALVYKTVGLLGYVSLVLDTLSLFAYAYYSNNRQDEGVLAYSIILGADGALLGTVDASQDKVPLTRTLGETGAILGGAGVALELILE
jgi:hypothetical protein